MSRTNESDALPINRKDYLGLRVRGVVWISRDSLKIN